MSIALAEKYSKNVDELFKAESKLNLLTNTDYDWTGAHTVRVYKLSTAPMNDYTRNRFSDDVAGEDSASLSRFGPLLDLSAQTEELLLKKDRSFIFNVDKMDTDETGDCLEAGKALARQCREVVVPEVDAYTYGVMCANAGTVIDGDEVTAESIYDAIIQGTEVLDDAEVPDTERVLLVSPLTYRIMKKSPDINLECDISEEMRLRGVIAMVDGMAVVSVPSSRLPAGFRFLIAHPSATTAPIKLEDYGTHKDTVLSSGTIVTGRIVYDAFVLENKASGLYYYTVAAEA